MSHATVCCFGEILWDIYEEGDVWLRRELGGAPANLAVGLARLGVRSAVVGGVGADRFGDALTAALAREGVDTRHVVRLKERTGIAFIRTDAAGEPSFLFYRQNTADMALEPSHITASMGRAKWSVVGTSTMVRDALAKATLRFVDVSVAGGSRLVVDLNVRRHLWRSEKQLRDAARLLCGSASLIKASSADLACLGWREETLVKRAPRAVWIVTHGGAGVFMRSRAVSHELSIVREPVVDATGAGDAFLAGVLASLSAHASERGASLSELPESTWVRTLRAGHAMARKAISRPGATAGLVRLGAIRRMVAASSQTDAE